MVELREEPDASEAFNAADETQVNNRKRSARRRDKAKTEALHRFLTDPAGRAWMWDLLSVCGNFQTSFDDNPSRMAFKEGSRNIGLRLLSEISPDALLLILKERGNG